MTIPFLDLKSQYEALKPQIDKAVLNVLGSTQFVLGQAVEEFEQRFATYCQTRHAIACSSGTSALHLALAAAGVGQDDEVIIPAMTFVATAAAVDLAKAKPVLVDIDPVNCNMDPALIEQAITPKTKAIIPVHLYGQIADMQAITQIAKRHNLVVIEDAAQAHGAEQEGKRAGSFGIMGCFSFYPGKNLGAYGEGGCVTTNDDEMAARLRRLRDWGQAEKYNHVVKGFNYRMDGIQGAVLGVKMDHIEDWTEGRRTAASRYHGLLSGVPGIELPQEIPGNRHVYHVYGIRVEAAIRDRLLGDLRKRDIHCGLHYPIPVHLQPCYSELGHKPGDFPHAELLGAQELSLPMFAELTGGQQNEITRALEDLVPSGERK